MTRTTVEALEDGRVRIVYPNGVKQYVSESAKGPLLDALLSEQGYEKKEAHVESYYGPTLSGNRWKVGYTISGSGLIQSPLPKQLFFVPTVQKDRDMVRDLYDRAYEQAHTAYTPSLETMVAEMLMNEPHSEVVIGKGAAALVAYPPPDREKEIVALGSGDTVYSSITALYNKWRERENDVPPPGSVDMSTASDD